MAAASMELRPVPPGVDVFAHRGPANLVRLLPSSKFLAVVNDYPFTVDPSDAATQTVPHYVIEGVYARLFGVDQTGFRPDVYFVSWRRFFQVRMSRTFNCHCHHCQVSPDIYFVSWRPFFQVRISRNGIKDFIEFHTIP